MWSSRKTRSSVIFEENVRGAFRRAHDSGIWGIYCAVWSGGSQDGTWSVLKGSCTVVRDFTDLSYHSFMDYLKDFREKEPKRGHPYEIKCVLSVSPSCLGSRCSSCLTSSIALCTDRKDISIVNCNSLKI